MALALDPAYPLVWRSPESVQFGVEEPLTVLHGVTDGEERLLGVLASGASPHTIATIAAETGVDGVRLAAFFSRLGPAVHRPRARRPPRPGAASAVVVVDGGCAIAAATRALLERHGVAAVCDPATAQGRRISCAVIVADYAVAPDRVRHWLRDDVRHLLVTVGDRTGSIGPFVDPGSGPCHHCLDLARLDADPAWPNLASQLLTRTAVARSALLNAEVAARAARCVLEALAAPTLPSYLAHESTVIDAATGALSSRTHSVHPRCGCGTPRESVTPAAATNDRDRYATT